VTDPERPAGDRVDRGAVRAAVIGQKLLDGDALAAVKGDRALEKANRGSGFVILERLDIGQAAAVVDRDMHLLPASVLRFVVHRACKSSGWPCGGR
jgi:hypothetical protein